MRVVNFLIIIFTSFLVISCSKVADPVKKIGIGNRIINYQADEKVDNLVIPPDLTIPNSENLFSEDIELKNDDDIISKAKNVEIKRDNYRRWLEVDKSPNEVWALSKEFFRSYGFQIKKENQKNWTY
jgi:outer membrane protein assembly factor BamC